MRKESLEFLRLLQHEMNTQDNVGQAHPRFWVIMDYKWVMTGEGRGDSRLYCFDLYESEAFSDEEIGEALVEYILDNELETKENEDDIFYKEWDIDDIKKADFDLAEEVLDELEMDHEIVYENFEGFIVPNTMFLTIRAAKQHLESNHYHYHKKAHTYAMTAWRSPQVQNLFEIIMNENFEEETNWLIKLIQKLKDWKN